MRLIVVGLALACSVSLLSAISYVEASNGLSNPGLESGHTQLRFADVNNDGNPDILSIGDHANPGAQEQGLMTWFGDGQGNWSLAQYGSNFGYGGIAVGDLNRDGDLDVAFAMHHDYAPSGQLGSKLMEAALGDGTGRNWVAWDTGLASNGETWGMFGTDLADFDNDGWLDMISVTFGFSGIRAYLNLHNGHWTQSFAHADTVAIVDHIVCGDINNDGNVDFAVGAQHGTAFLGDGAGSFTNVDRNLPPFSAQGGRAGVWLGDVDNDGAEELSLVNINQGVDVWKWNSAGDSWVNVSDGLPTSGSYQTTRIYDMNCDGFMDVIGFGNETCTVWLGDGGAHWTEGASFATPAPGDYSALEAGGDMDHNGFPDLALVDDESPNVLHCFKEASVPESLRITPMLPRGGEKFVPGSAQFIDWVCAVPPGGTAEIRLDISFTGPTGPWSPVATNLKNSGRYQYVVPDTPSTDCYVRYIGASGAQADTVLTPRAFTILGPAAVAGNLPTARHRVYLSASVSPNPAAGKAVVNYELPGRSPIRVSIHDASGRQTMCLVAATQAAGRHQLSLDPHLLSPGIYFCRVQTDSGATVSKFVMR